MSDDINQAKSAAEGWHLGQTSSRYESSSRGAGVISTGKGDHGGVSYGAYQLSTKMGTLREYLEQSRYGAQFGGLTPATPEFDAKWRELARSDPGFAKDQHDFIGKSHYNEQNDRLKGRGLDLSDRGPAVQDALWSTSVQFRNLAPTIFAKGLEEKFGKDYKLSDLSDKDIVVAVQDYKIAHNSALFKSSPEWWPGLLKRANAEKADLVQLATQEHSRERVGSPAKSAADRAPGHSESGAEIRQVQDFLNKFGYRDARGHAIKEDGDFGQRTKEAVQAFQQAHGLKSDGVLGPKTLGALKKAEHAPLLSDPRHPDHGMFKQAVAGLEKVGGFKNREELEKAAGTTVFEAKASGLTRIDHVMANANGAGLFSVQGALDDPAHRRVYVDKAQAVSQPIEQSTVQVQQEAQQAHRQAAPSPQPERESQKALAP